MARAPLGALKPSLLPTTAKPLKTLRPRPQRISIAPQPPAADPTASSILSELRDFPCYRSSEREFGCDFVSMQDGGNELACHTPSIASSVRELLGTQCTMWPIRFDPSPLRCHCTDTLFIRCQALMDDDRPAPPLQPLLDSASCQPR